MHDAYTEEFLRRLKENLNLRRQREVFEAILGEVVWEILPADITNENIKKNEAFKICFHGKSKGESEIFNCYELLSDAIKSAKELGVQRFHCPDSDGFCMGLQQGNQIYGFIIVCGFTKELNEGLLNIFVAFTQTVMREVQKEMELTKLYDTIRPRAIALSTIHTVHRLMSSTLDLEELMPKIARLVLQVMRVEVCRIYMLQRDKSKLFIKVIAASAKEAPREKGYANLTADLKRLVKTAASILKPKELLVPLIDEDVIGIISVRNKLGEKPFGEFDKEILMTFAEQAVIAIRNAQLYEEQEKITIGTIKSLAAILDMHAPHIYTHSAAFAELVVEIAKELGVPAREIRVLKYASLLHDAGKIMIPDSILKKPKRLTGAEYNIVKRHHIKAVEIVKPIELLKPVVPVILHHHEKYDGTGYPKGLKGDGIPLGSRIMAVVDAFVAMVSKQPYRERITIQEAIQEIKRYSGTQFDPKVINAFLSVVERVDINKLLKKKFKET